MVAVGALACGPNPKPASPPSPLPDPLPPPPEPVKTVQVQVERDAACARRSDGSVWCWGDVFVGYRAEAGRVKNLPPASDLAVGDEQACIVAEDDGSVWCWGRSARMDDPSDPTVPRRVAGLPPMKRVVIWQGDDTRRVDADNRARACGLDRERTVWCWRGADRPVNLGGKGATDIAMGVGSVCVLLDGAHHCTSMGYADPAPLEFIPFSRRLTTIGFAGRSRCGHLEHGALHCWGPICGREKPAEGCDIGGATGSVLHLGGGLDRLLVSRDGGLHDYRYIRSFGGRIMHDVLEPPYASGDAGGFWYACGVTVAGEARCWGRPRVGPPRFSSERPFVLLDAPIHERYQIPVTAPVAVSREAICGAGEGRKLRCWVPARMSEDLGVDEEVRLSGYGLGTVEGAVRAHLTANNLCLVFANAPARCVGRRVGSVMEWEGASQTTMHGRSACGVFGPERELRCRLGRTREEVVEDAAGPFHGVEHVVIRNSEPCAVREGQAYCFDRSESRMVPVEGVPAGVTEVALGDEHRCALAAGQVWCWGRGGHGQLGQGRLRGASKPVRVDGLAGVQHIAAAFHHTCALDASGRVHCWGGNIYGQLGDGTRMSRARPVPVEGLSGVLALALADAMTCVVRRDDTVCWGQGAWHAFGPVWKRSMLDALPPAPVVGIGEEVPPRPARVTVEVSLP